MIKIGKMIKKLAKTKKEIRLLPDGGKKERLTALLEKAEFLNGELNKLQGVLIDKGWVEKYQNGANQYGLKKSTEGDVYNSLIKNFSVVMRQIDDSLPSADVQQDEFLNFVRGDTK